MDIQVVTDQYDFLGVCHASREHFLHLQGPVEFGALRTDANLSHPARGSANNVFFMYGNTPWLTSYSLKP